jgi:hypothetical protein
VDRAGEANRTTTESQYGWVSTSLGGTEMNESRWKCCSSAQSTVRPEVHLVVNSATVE